METKKFLDGEGLKTLWSEITSLQSDYNETDETSPNYIKNKPFTIDVIPEEIIEEFTFTTSDTIDSSTGLPTMQYVQLFNDLTIGQKMNLQFTYPELAAATGLPQYDDNGEVIFKTVKFENIEVGNFADAMGSQFLDSPAIMMGPGTLIATLPESIQKVAIPNDDIVFVYSNATLANGAKTPLLITALMDWTTGGYSTYVNNCIINTFIPEDIQFNAESITKQALQANWDQSNKEEVDYIKNKPFGEEILITPINEIYIKDFPLLTDDDLLTRYADFSLGLEVDKSYTVKVYDKNNNLITTIATVGVEAQSVNSIFPTGITLLYASNIDEVFAADGLDFDVNGNPIYNPNKTILFNIDDDVYKSEIVELPVNGRTYNRIKIKKIPSEYLEIDVDQEFSETSENPQSGIAVKNAIVRLTNSLPSNVITKLTNPTTLGDQHVKVQHSNTNTDTYPNSATYDIYTEGIGLNSDLNTTKKDTLVAAINENVAAIDDINNKTTLATSLDSEVIWVNGEPKILKNSYIPYTEIPYKYSLKEPVGSKCCVTANNIFIDLYDLKLYSIQSDGTIRKKDLVVKDEEQFAKISQIVGVFYNTYSKNIYMDYEINDSRNTVTYSTETTYYFHTKNTDETYSKWYIDDGTTLRYYFDSTETLSGTYTPVGDYYSRQNETSSYDGGTWPNKYTKTTKITAGICNGFKQTDLEKPGLLEGYSVTFGAENYTNAQVIGVDAGYNFFRALQSDGTEIINSYRASVVQTSFTKTGIDNNEHSSYVRLSDRIIMCLSSSGEILYRNADYQSSSNFGTITQRKTVSTETDLFTGNLQYVKLHIQGDTLYATRHNKIYAINYKDSNPTAICLNESHTEIIPSFINSYKVNLIELNFNSNDSDHLDSVKVNLLSEVFNPNKIMDDSMEFIFDGGNAPIE